MNVPDWFNNVITEGLQALYTLNLQDRPPADTIGYTCDVWIKSLWRYGGYWVADDAARFDAAFAVLARRCTRWPTPNDLLTSLPKRDETKSLEDGNWTQKERSENIQRLKSLLKKNSLPKTVEAGNE